MLVRVLLIKLLVRAIIIIGKTRNKIVLAETVAKNALSVAVENVSLLKIKALIRARTTTTTACVRAQVEELIDPKVGAPPTSRSTEFKAGAIQITNQEE